MDGGRSPIRRGGDEPRRGGGGGGPDKDSWRGGKTDPAPAKAPPPEPKPAPAPGETLLKFTIILICY